MAAIREFDNLAARSGSPLRLVGVLLGLLLLFGATRPVAAGELVMFFDTGCPWCVRWDREVGEAYERSEEGRRAPLRRLNISTARNSGLRLASAVTVTPTFVLVDGGVEVGRITGYPGADFFWGMLGELLAKLAPAVPDKPRDASLSGKAARLGTRPVGISAGPFPQSRLHALSALWTPDQLEPVETSRHGAG